MMFLKLTQWSGHRIPVEQGPDNKGHGRSLYINALLITDFFQLQGNVFETKTDYRVPIAERKVETYTEICFCCANHEGQMSRTVQETPEQILALIEEEMK